MCKNKLDNHHTVRHKGGKTHDKLSDAECAFEKDVGASVYLEDDPRKSK